ncbi:hypothetical protein BGZ95_001766 [Linnemannia exigua]|uniref:ER-bound oxygenase mpaB/mpaB'/Rubber oxygenase catalytic domain-containing protein n=1 Tax=Linnemannia exigua TaxID=604196 RepID=A0AAD4H3U1_9FUNG|nr:hypothetical protein BGZ95_001766 [Linnemannia exigua]
MALVRHLRYRRINALLHKYPDPTLPLRDLKVAKEVSTATGGYDFPYLNAVSLEFALFKTYAIPSISKILAATQQFAAQCPKRVDDTGLILAEMTEAYRRQSYRSMTEAHPDLGEDEMDAKRQQVALEKLNFIHGHYPIRQEDYLYTLALFVLEPVSWLGRFEWRGITELEKNALLGVWRHTGTNMKIENIPGTFDELAQWAENYERENMVYAHSNVAIASATTRHLLSRAPKALHPLGRHIVSTLLTNRLRTAFAIPNPPRGLTTLIVSILTLRKYFIRYFFLPKRYPLFRSALRANEQGKFVPRFNKYAPIYPDGYHIEDLGPSKFMGQCPVLLKTVQLPLSNDKLVLV